MAATGYTPISLYYSTTAAAAPSAVNLVNGELAINITDGKLYYKDNLGVVKSFSSGGAAYVRTSFTATSGQTTFSATYAVGFVEVFLNGVLLNAADYTASNGTSVVLATGAALNDIVELIAFQTIAITNASTANLLGGGASQLVYQTGVNATGFIPNGTSGQALISNGTSAPGFGTLSVAGGGTGLATLTANSVLLGNGTSALQAVAPGSTGNVLTSNGTTWSSTAPAVGGFSTMSVITSSGSFTVPAGKTTLKITAVGGGGSGGSNSNTSQRGCGGGGGGGMAVKYLSVTPGQNVTITIGAGGSAPSAGSNANGNAGGTTTAEYASTNIAVATGGTGGKSSNGPGGDGGIGTTGDLLLAGNGGEACSVDTTGGSQGGLGGGSPFGGGAAGSSYSQPSSINGRNYGGGGTGGFLGSTVGAGGSGVVVIEY